MKGIEAMIPRPVIWTWNGLLRLQRAVMLLAIVVSASAAVVEVTMRYIFHSSIVGIEELAAYTAFWMYFIGAAYGTYSRSHITAELTHLLITNPRYSAALRAVTNFITCALLIYIIPWGWRYFQWGLSKQEQSSSTLLGQTYPVVYFQSAIFFGIVLMAFYFLIETFLWARAVIINETPDELLSEREGVESWI